MSNNEDTDSKPSTLPGKLQGPQPTWEEVERTRAKVVRRSTASSETELRLCIKENSTQMTKGYGNRQGQQRKVLRSAPTRLTCFERMSKQMAEAQRQARTEKGERLGLWTWPLQRWQVVRIEGHSMISKYLNKEAGTRDSTQTVLAKMAGVDAGLIEKQVHIEPLDRKVAGWALAVKAFYWRALQPGLNMGRLLVDSWRNGEQQAIFGTVWTSVADGAALTTAKKVCHGLDRTFDDLVEAIVDKLDDDKD
ncbi:hypothetical protein GGI07_005728 [Coemansia sp. Benny D115]|nr:hypothetical protein GGI07_005728 [Coemansia sp. Benny D115]